VKRILHIAIPVKPARKPLSNTKKSSMRRYVRRHRRGVFEVQWSSDGKATAMGQLAFFAEFLQASGLFEKWVRSCPLRYTSPNAPTVQDVLGT
jgi:hypothetical protein